MGAARQLCILNSPVSGEVNILCRSPFPHTRGVKDSNFPDLPNVAFTNFIGIFPHEIEPGRLEKKKNGYAIGMSFAASGAAMGLGYDTNRTISAGLGYSTGQISANAFYAKWDRDYMHLGSDGRKDTATNTVADGDLADTTATAGYTGLGVDLSYTMGRKG